MCDDWGEIADAALGETAKESTPQAKDDWGGTSESTNKTTTPQASDDWGSGGGGGASSSTDKASTQANDDGWGAGTSSSTSGSNNKTTTHANDDWGSSNTTTTKGSDDWGSSSTTTKGSDDWGSGGGGGGGGGGYGNRRNNNQSSDNWGGGGGRGGRGGGGGFGGRGGGRGGFGGRGGGGGFGGRGGRGGGGNNSNRSYNDRPNDSWGGSTGGNNNNTSVNDDWGSSSKSTNNSTSKANDDWGSTDNSSSKTTAQDDDPWGCTGTSTTANKTNDDDGGWGGTTSNGNSGGWSSNDNNRSGDRNNQNNNNKGDGDDQEERKIHYKPEQLNLEEEAELQAGDAGENFKKYKEQIVNCLPLGVIEPVEKFEDVIESKLLLGNLKTLKYSEMTPIQKWAMPAIRDGHDIIGCAQTGSGKTAAFLLPVLQTIMKIDMEPHNPNSDCQSPYCLIISPTRELARQIYTHAEILSKDSIVKCRVIYGQVSTFHLKAQMSMGCHILVTTMGRLKDFLGRGWVDFKNIKWVILDEGDRLVDERSGSDVGSIFQHESMPPKEKRQTLFFSATFKEAVQESAREFLRIPFIFLSVGRVGAANEDIRQEFIQVTREEKKRKLKVILDGVPPEDKTIIFTQTKAGADMLAAYFTSLKLESTSIHGDRHQSQREEAISLFRRGKKRFLISSPVGNRGLDLPKVTLVINYDLPESVDEYVHRIGRTGRAGHTGKAISFYDPGRDRELVPELLRILKDAKQEIPDWLSSEETGLTAPAATTDDSFGSSEKRPAEDEAGNEVKKVDTGDQPPAAAKSADTDWW